MKTNDPMENQQNSELQEQVMQLREQLMQAQKLSSVGALTASITHEFNNILTTVINYSKMGLRHKNEATREKAFTKILSAGQRASKITTGMLSYARNKGNRREPMNLVHLVQDVLVLAEKDLQMHRVKLQTDFFAYPYAEVNASQIQQVVLNLVINGRQAMEGGGRMFLSVLANKKTGMAEIAVRDTGSGIPAHKLAKIFDPFYSTKKADEQGQGGTGLGLALCREVVESHKGRIRVESVVGQGTTFTLKFPIVSAPASVMEMAAPAHPMKVAG